jgi:hypothetical protein
LLLGKRRSSFYAERILSINTFKINKIFLKTENFLRVSTDTVVAFLIKQVQFMEGDYQGEYDVSFKMLNIREP